MSDRVCYIRRSDRGGALRGLRLVGGHADDTWQAGNGNDPSLIAQSIAQGAQWIRDRLDASTSKSRSLSVLCLDPDGAVCSWVKPEDADTSLLDAVITGASAKPDLDALDEPETHQGIGERFPQLPLELSFEFLDSDETSTGSRAAVMACPDVPGRLLKDELDAMGIRVDKFTSIWHAIASVWDPGAGNAAHSAQRIVSSDAPITAVIAIDAQDGRLIWTWSREGRLIVGGASRIALAQGEHEHLALIRHQDIARICSDWLGWSSQLGLAPAKIVFVGNPGQIESLPDPASSLPEHSQKDAQGRRGLSAAQIGAALAKAWPDATIDLIEHDDPIGESLHKLASGHRGKDIRSLSALEHRPGKVHRRMYRWAGVALVAVSAMIGLLGYELFTQADQVRQRAAELEVQRMEAITSYDQSLVLSSYVIKDLQGRLDQMRRSQGPLSISESNPIMEELETLSYVFGAPGIEIITLRLNNTTVTVTIRVEDIAHAEQVNQSLTAIRGSHLRWRPFELKNRGQQIEATFIARWKESGGDS